MPSAMNKDFGHSVNAANLEYKEEPMDGNYSNAIVGIISRGRVNKLLSEMGNLRGKKVLDVGCEAGYVSLRMITKGADVYSFDICKSALIAFKKKKNSGKAKIFMGAAQKMPLKDEFFDYVICTEVIEHMPLLDLCISEMKRVLKPRGKVLITFPNEGLRRLTYPAAKLFGVNTDIEEKVTLYEYKFEEISSLAKKYFKIEKKYSWPFMFPLTRFVVGRK
jgi:2-polyprenyl-3-methyl-5-hydroxy-6-metoxy-1,4-benzoquinol methylase